MKKEPTVEEVTALNAKIILTVREAASLAGIATGTLYRRWAEGNGPESLKVGRCRRITRKALDKWLSQNIKK